MKTYHYNAEPESYPFVNNLKTPGLLKKYERFLNAIEKAVIDHHKIDSLPTIFAFTGTSGMGAATMLNMAYMSSDVEIDVNFWHVKKQNSDCHRCAIEKSYPVFSDYYRSHATIIFLDDFVSTGNTFRQTRDAIAGWCSWFDEFDGAALTATNSLSSEIKHLDFAILCNNG